MKKQILSEEFKRMQKLAGLITEEEVKASSEKEDEVKAILKADYPTFVQKLGDNIKDPKFRAAIKSIANKAPIQTTDIAPKVTDLKPTQNEIDVTKSLQFPLTNVTSAEVILKGGTISVAGKKIITGGGGKFIIDGHHRWSQVYVVNPEASITAIDISNIENPIDGLKATQLGIAGDTGKIDTVTVSGQNLLKMNETQLKKYVVKTITPEVAEVFKNILGMEKLNAASNITKEALNQMELATLKPLIANYIWKNVQMMQQNNQPVPNAPKRDIMPQTDNAKQWTDDAVVPSDIAAESKKRMQKLAGLINEAFDPFLDTDMGGWIREYIDEIAGDEGIESKPEFDVAFNLALSKLSQEQFPLYVSDDSKLAPGFIKPKGIGFVMNNNEGTITPEIIQIFNDNYGVIDINYIKNFFANKDNWKMINNENDVANYKKLYLIDTKSNKIGNKESFF